MAGQLEAMKYANCVQSYCYSVRDRMLFVIKILQLIESIINHVHWYDFRLFLSLSDLPVEKVSKTNKLVIWFIQIRCATCIIRSK